MRVVYFTTGFFLYVIEFANAVSKKGNDVYLMLPDDVDPLILKMVDVSVKVKPYRNVNFISFRKNLKWLLGIRGFLRSVRPDVVHVQSYGHRWFHWLYVSWPKYKLYNTIHDPSPHTGDIASIKALAIMKQCLRWLPRFTKAVFVHGKSMKNELLLNKKFRENAVHIIHHGELSVYKKFEQSNQVTNIKSNSILFFGRIWAYKGLDIFLEAAKLVLRKYPNQHFNIAGKGEDIVHYKNQVKEVEQSFSFFNYRIPNIEVADFFSSCLFTVLPYKDATQSGVIPVAFAFQKTVIATTVGALPEVVKDGYNGILIPPGDHQSLADAMIKLIENPSLRELLEQNAKFTADNDLSWAVIADKALSVYKKD